MTANVLNVRYSPNCDCGVLTRVRYGETYPIIGRNADSSWWQINVNGTVGWVFGRFTEVFNTAYVPLTDYSSAVQLPTTGYNVTASVDGRSTQPSWQPQRLSGLYTRRPHGSGGRTNCGQYLVAGQL